MTTRTVISIVFGGVLSSIALFLPTSLVAQDQDVPCDTEFTFCQGTFLEIGGIYSSCYQDIHGCCDALRYEGICTTGPATWKCKPVPFSVHNNGVCPTASQCRRDDACDFGAKQARQ